MAGGCFVLEIFDNFKNERLVLDLVSRNNICDRIPTVPGVLAS
jgi:hypothetical protein